MTSTRPVSSTPGAATTSTAHGSARPASEAAGPTRPLLEHRARGQLGILGVLGLCEAVCLWVAWRTGPGKVRALDLPRPPPGGGPPSRCPRTASTSCGNRWDSSSTGCCLCTAPTSATRRLAPDSTVAVSVSARLSDRQGLIRESGQIGGDHAANCTPASDSTPGLGSGFAPS